jgi:4-hydroxy-tetrahydrodipicolinate synthase
MAPIDPAAATLAGQLRGGLVPAVLTPMTSDRDVHAADLERYAAGFGAHPGLAVWAHTGRGPYLTGEQRALVLRTFRAATSASIVAGIAPSVADPDTPPVAIAAQAAELGANALMVFPPPDLADAPDRIYDLHNQIATEIGLPIILFVLHAEAGGYPYPPALLRDLLSIPQVAGVKLATLDSAMTCQDAILLLHNEFPGRLAITGEDRMFGPSLMWGADAALVGIAAASAELSASLLRTWYSRDDAFIRVSQQVDEFSYATFRAPMEGYVQRMAWAAEREGLISAAGAYDPFGPPLPAAERDAVHAAVDRVLAGSR